MLVLFLRLYLWKSELFIGRFFVCLLMCCFFILCIGPTLFLKIGIVSDPKITQMNLTKNNINRAVFIKVHTNLPIKIGMPRAQWVLKSW